VEDADKMFLKCISDNFVRIIWVKQISTKCPLTMNHFKFKTIGFNIYTSSSLGLRLSFGYAVLVFCSAEKKLQYVAARIDRAITSRLKIMASPRKKGLNEGHPYSTGLQYHKLNRQMVPHKYGLESLGSVVRAKRYVK